MNYHENCELIVRLLSEHGAKIPILKTLSVLPRSFPMHKLKTFFTIEIKTPMNKSKIAIWCHNYTRLGQLIYSIK